MQREIEYGQYDLEKKKRNKKAREKNDVNTYNYHNRGQVENHFDKML